MFHYMLIYFNFWKSKINFASGMFNFQSPKLIPPWGKLSLLSQISLKAPPPKICHNWKTQLAEEYFVFSQPCNFLTIEAFEIIEKLKNIFQLEADVKCFRIVQILFIYSKRYYKYLTCVGVYLREVGFVCRDWNISNCGVLICEIVFIINIHLAW